jgi:hypothetical protein
MSRGKFVYCRNSGALYKSMRHLEKGPSKQKVEENEMEGEFFC